MANTEFQRLPAEELYQTELDALIAANPQIKNPDLIYAGDKVTIP